MAPRVLEEMKAIFGRPMVPPELAAVSGLRPEEETSGLWYAAAEPGADPRQPKMRLRIEGFFDGTWPSDADGLLHAYNFAWHIWARASSQKLRASSSAAASSVMEHLMRLEGGPAAAILAADGLLKPAPGGRREERAAEAAALLGWAVMELGGRARKLHHAELRLAAERGRLDKELENNRGLLALVDGLLAEVAEVAAGQPSPLAADGVVTGRPSQPGLFP
jgi:hypothetical protein